MIGGSRLGEGVLPERKVGGTSSYYSYSVFFFSLVSPLALFIIYLFFSFFFLMDEETHRFCLNLNVEGCDWSCGWRSRPIQGRGLGKGEEWGWRTGQRPDGAGKTGSL